MATFLDVSALENFSVIFVFLLVFVGSYAILQLTKVLGQNPFINAMISLVIAFLSILSPITVQIFESILPFIAIVLLLTVMVSAAAGMFGKFDIEAIPSMKWIMIAMFVIILAVGTLVVVRQNIEVPERGEDFGKVSTVIFHPNLLGMILILIIAVFTIGLLASKQT